MKKVYRYQFNTTIIVFAIIATLIALSGIVYSALRLAGVFEQTSIFPIIDISAIIVCSLIQIAMIILFFDTKYIISDDFFILKMFFIKKKIPAESLNYVAEDEETKEIFLYFVTNPSEGIFEFLPILIKKEKNKDFFADMKKCYPTIIFDKLKID